MKKTDISQLTDSQKLNYLIEKVDRLDKTAHPSHFRRIARWSANHWLIILSLGGIAWAMLHMWDEIRTLMSFVTGINDSVESMKSTFSGFGGNIKANTTIPNEIGDAFKDVLNDFKFWE